MTRLTTVVLRRRWAITVPTVLGKSGGPFSFSYQEPVDPPPLSLPDE